MVKENDTKIIELNADNFTEQVIQYGFFGEQIPKCFSSKGLAEKCDQILKPVSIAKNQTKKGNKNTTSPTVISTYKNGVTRRILSLPNPEAFIRLVKLFRDNWGTIMEYALSDHSLSPITHLREYQEGFIEEINSESAREVSRAKSDYIEGIKESIKTSLGYQYRLKVDIANCYNTIYTHSIAWAICGKEMAKGFYKTGEPKEIEDKYELADKMDAFIRFQKNNETNGIVVGPYTSRIFSEILLAGIDKELEREGFVFKRYVDDYKFYFRSEPDAKQSIQVIEHILNRYNLSLNIAKTEIQLFPYEIISDIKESYDSVFRKEGIFGVLNMASIFHTKGEKGAYKYALKYIKKKKLNSEELTNVCPLLINIMLLDPKYGNHIIAFLKNNKKALNLDDLSEIVNQELIESIKQNLQQETLLFLYLVHEMRLTINGESVEKIIRNGDDFSRIMALDIWKRHKNLVTRNRAEARSINIAREELANQLSTEKYSGEHWLLLYESARKNLFNGLHYTPPEMNAFFALLDQNNVSFYEYN